MYQKYGWEVVSVVNTNGLLKDCSGAKQEQLALVGR